MSEPSFNLGAGPKRTAADVVLVVLLVAVVVAICAHGPSQTYAYSQIRWVGIAMGALRDGNWLLPRNHLGEIAHKPQLYFWLEAALLKLTGIHHDFVFRLPTIAAGFVTAVMIYVLGRRWYGRRVGLLAAGLWATLAQMSKMIYLGTTDMLLTMWVTASILCVDRLLFHRVAPARRRRWVIGLWVTMIFGALTKGWGVVNPVLVGGMVALAVAARPGFKAIRRQSGAGRKSLLALRLIGRRWRRAAKAVRLGWGLLAMVAVLVPVWIGMLAVGGQQFRNWIYYGIWQRMTGAGFDPPKSTNVPPPVQLLYHALPASVFALGALLLVRIRSWMGRTSPVCLPLCWILAVVIPFSLTHGFRPDYLLPCYAAVALLGAWAVETVHRRGRTGARNIQVLRHVFAGAALLVAVALIGGSTMALWQSSLPKLLRKAVRVPDYLDPESWWVLAALVPLGVLAAAAAVWASLRWQVRRVAAVAVIGMVGVAFLRTHVVNRHACTRDGEKMIDFARRAAKVLGDDDFAVYRVEHVATEIYVGRFGQRLADPREDIADAVALLNRGSTRWLVTCERGLIELGARRTVKDGSKEVYVALPEEFGRARVVGEPIFSRGWGRPYLIELKRPVKPSCEPKPTPYVSGKRGKFW